MMFAMTYEQALKYVPHQNKKASASSCSGERMPCSRGWQSCSRADFGFNRPDRSWKRHRRLQRGSVRI